MKLSQKSKELMKEPPAKMTFSRSRTNRGLKNPGQKLKEDLPFSNRQTNSLTNNLGDSQGEILK